MFQILRKNKVNKINIKWDGIGYKTEFIIGEKWTPVGNGGLDVLKIRFKNGVLEVKQLRMFSSTEPQHMKWAIERLEEEGYVRS